MCSLQNGATSNLPRLQDRYSKTNSGLQVLNAKYILLFLKFVIHVNVLFMSIGYIPVEPWRCSCHKEELFFDFDGVNQHILLANKLRNLDSWYHPQIHWNFDWSNFYHLQVLFQVAADELVVFQLIHWLSLIFYAFEPVHQRVGQTKSDLKFYFLCTQVHKGRQGVKPGFDLKQDRQQVHPFQSTCHYFVPSDQ